MVFSCHHSQPPPGLDNPRVDVPHKDDLFRTREWGAVVSPASEKLAEPKDVSYGTNSLGQLEDGKNVTSLLQVSLPAPLQPKLPQQ